MGYTITSAKKPRMPRTGGIVKPAGRSLAGEMRPQNPVGSSRRTPPSTGGGKIGIGSARKARLYNTGGTAVHAANYPPLSSSESLAPLSGGMLHTLPNPSSLAVHAAGWPPLKSAPASPKGGKTRVPLNVSATKPHGIKHKRGMEHESDEIAKNADVYAAHNNPTPAPTPEYSVGHGGSSAAQQIKDLDLFGKVQ